MVLIIEEGKVNNGGIVLPTLYHFRKAVHYGKHIFEMVGMRCI